MPHEQESPRNLWKICGTLEVQSVLHIGNGRPISEPENKPSAADPSSENQRGFVRDFNGNPFIPGSEFKGAITSWFDSHFESEPVRDALFGAGDESPNSCGGKVAVCDAKLQAKIDPNRGRHLSYYSESSGTFIRFGNSIERWNGAAKHQFLYGTELVPAGTKFHVQLLAKNLSQEEVEFLLRLLDGFNTDGRDETIRIGAGQQNGWGACRFILGDVATIAMEEAFELALKDPSAKSCNFDFCKVVDAKDLKARAKEEPLNPDCKRAKLGVDLVFEDGFLINDPDQAWVREDSVFAELSMDGEQRASNSTLGEKCKTPLLDANGHPVVTAETLRGVLRSRAEKILRTLVPEEYWSQVVTSAGKVATEPSLTDQVFGTAGNASKLAFTDFHLVDVKDSPSGLVHHDYVAINRISGGGAESLKFDIQAAHRCTLRGEISLDVELACLAAGEECLPEWQVGLLALVLMDASAGDISLGFGKTKDLGRFLLNIRTLKIPSKAGASWEAVFQGVEAVSDLPADKQEALRQQLRKCVEALIAKLGEITGQAVAVSASEHGAVEKVDPVPAKFNAATCAGNEFLNNYQFVPMLAGSNAADDLPLADWPKLNSEDRTALPKWQHVTHACWKNETGEEGNKQPVFSGVLNAKLKLEKDLVVGGQQIASPNEHTPSHVYPFRLPMKSRQGWELAIPATSFRGMISSLAEAASNSALRVITPQKLTRRASVDAREALPAVGMVVGTKGSRKILPLCLPTLTCNAKPPYTVSIPNHWQSAFSDFQYEAGIPPMRVYLNAYQHQAERMQAKAGTLLGDCAPSESYSSANRRYYYMPILKAKYNRGRWTIEDEIHQKIIETRRGKIYFALGHSEFNYEEIEGWPSGLPTHAPLPATQFAKLPKHLADGLVNNYEYRRGIFRIFGLDSDKPANLPPTKIHEWFLPLSEEAEHGRPKLAAEERILEFELLASENGAYQLLGAPEDRESMELKDGDLVCFDIDENLNVTEVAISSLWRKEVGQLHEIVARTSPRLLPVGFESNYPEIAAAFQERDKVITLAEQMFGFVESFPGAEEKGGRNGKALASRVHFRHLRPTEGHEPQVHEEGRVLKILDAPKLPSPSLYFEPQSGKAISKGSIKEDSSTKLRGRKQYLHGEAEPNRSESWYTNDPSSRPQQKAMVHPIKADGKSQFDVQVEFDNLSLRELGLLCYSLQPVENYWHKLGMGKSLGLGSVSIDALSLSLIDRKARYLDAFADSFSPASPVVQEGSVVENIRSGFRNSMPGKIRQPLELIGCSHNDGLPVHGPQTKSSTNLEDKSYEWHVRNDDAKTGSHAALPVLDENSTTLKPMRKN